jgi:hypothetical protein
MEEGFRRHPTSMGRRADIRLNHEVPPPCAGLRATRIRRRNPHHHRRNRNPSQAMALSLLKHALKSPILVFQRLPTSSNVFIWLIMDTSMPPYFARRLQMDALFMPCTRRSSATGTPPSA